MSRATSPELGSWVVDGNGSFRFAHTDPGEGTYALTIQGLESEPVEPSSGRPTSVCSSLRNKAAPARVISRRHG